MRKFVKIFGIVILCLLLLFLSFLLFLVLKSRLWEKEFVASLDTEYLVSDGIVLDDILNGEIESYILSEEDTDSITLSPTQVAQLVYGTLTDVAGDSGLNITNVYIVPAIADWKVCSRLELKDMWEAHIWVCVDVSKDNMQTAQLYLKDIQCQGFSVSKIYPKLLILANQGIADALVTANENGFVGRIFENVELMEEYLVIKGGLY
ncbi:TPA: hypothetical protein DEP90_02750 [Patescibacteria group bacterium]|nr:hypothetical protein [Patescibacteria group bacterium]